MNSVSASATWQSRSANLFCMGAMINACSGSGGGGVENMLGGPAMPQYVEFAEEKKKESCYFQQLLKKNAVVQ